MLNKYLFYLFYGDNMLFPDYKNTTSVTLTTNTNPSYTVTQDCMVYTRLSGVGENQFAVASLFIDGVNLSETIVPSDFGISINSYTYTLFIKAGSTVSIKVTNDASGSVSVTLKLIPLTNMGGGGV